MIAFKDFQEAWDENEGRYIFVSEEQLEEAFNRVCKLFPKENRIFILCDLVKDLILSEDLADEVMP